MTDYHIRWVRPPEQPEDPERIVIRETLAFGRAVYDQRRALGPQRRDTQCDLGRRGDAGVPGVMAGVSAVLEKPLMQRIHANAPGCHAAGSRLADELAGGVRASCARCTGRPHPRLGWLTGADAAV